MSDDDDPPPRTTTTKKAKKTRFVVIDDTHPKGIKRVDRFTFAYKRAIARAQREAKRTGKEVERRMRDAFFFLPHRGSTEEEEEGSKKRMETHRRRRRHDSGEKDYSSSSGTRWFSMLSAAVGEKTVDPMKRSAKRLSNEAKEKVRKLRANLKRDTTPTAKKNRRKNESCLLYTSPSPRDRQKSRMPSSA